MGCELRFELLIAIIKDLRKQNSEFWIMISNKLMERPDIHPVCFQVKSFARQRNVQNCAAKPALTLFD